MQKSYLPCRWVEKAKIDKGWIVTLLDGEKVRILGLIDDDDEETDDPIAAVSYYGNVEMGFEDSPRLVQFSLSQIRTPG